MGKYEIIYTAAHKEVNLTSVYEKFNDLEKAVLLKLVKEHGYRNIHAGNLVFVNAFIVLRIIERWMEKNNVETEIIKTETIYGVKEKHLVRVSTPEVWVMVKLAEKLMNIPEAFDPMYFSNYEEYHNLMDRFYKINRNLK